MNEYITVLQNEIGFFYSIIKFVIYFLIGAFFLILINKIVQFFSFIFSRFSKERFLDRLNFIFKLLIFILISTFIGWILIYIAF
jgi:hypothetical protein